MVCQVTLNLSASLSLGDGEFLGVVGDVKELGSWDVNNSLQMISKTSNSSSWEVSFNVCEAMSVRYRYFVGMIKTDAGKRKFIVKNWESHLTPRTLISSGKTLTINDGSYGIVTGSEKKIIDIGWLTEQHELRFSISSPKSSPFLEMLENDENNPRSSISSFQVLPEASQSALDTSFCKITPFNYLKLEGHSDRRVKIPTADNIHYVFTVQCFAPRQEYVKFHIFTESGQNFGLGVISCYCLPTSMGTLKVPVLNKDQIVVAFLRVPYLHVKPFSSSLSMERCFTRHWKKRPMLHAGHRGSGNSFTSKKLANVFENTLASFDQASVHGASYVEFDVHLTKDEVPVVYHDLTTCLAATMKCQGEKPSKSQLVQLPVKTLLLSELQSLTMNHKSRLNSSRALNFEENLLTFAHQPFPTLKQTFDAIPPHTGFNIEIKWPTLDQDGMYEDNMEHYFDANLFLDAILKVVFESAESRKIIFSSFDVDICIMLRRKQNRYPVLFLTNGDSDHYKPLLDLREASNEMAIGTAMAEGFLGLNTLEKDVYRNPEIGKKCHEAGLIFVCYGDDVGENLDVVEKASVDIAIYDRIYENKQLSTKNGFNL